MTADLAGLYLRARLRCSVWHKVRRLIVLIGVVIAGTVGLQTIAGHDVVVICSSVLATFMTAAIPGLWARIVLVPAPPTGLTVEHCAAVRGTAFPAVPGLVAGRIVLELLGPLAPISVALITAVGCTQPISTTAVTVIGAVATILAAGVTRVVGESRDSAPAGTAVLMTVVGATVVSVGLAALVATTSAETLISPTMTWMAAAGLQATGSVTALVVTVRLLDVLRTAPHSPRRRSQRPASRHQVSLLRLEVRLLISDQRRRTMALSPTVVACAGLVTSLVAGIDTPPSTAGVVACAFLGTMFWKERVDDHGLRQLLHQLPHGRQREMVARATVWILAALPMVVVAGILHGPFTAILTAMMSAQALAVGASATATAPASDWIRIYLRVLATILVLTIVEQSVYLVGMYYLEAPLAAAMSLIIGCLITAALVHRTRKRFSVDPRPPAASLATHAAAGRSASDNA